MKKKFLVLSSFIVIVILFVLIVIFYPRKVTHAVISENGKGYTNLYINGKLKKIKSEINYPKLTVINYKYNLFNIYGVQKVSACSQRIMDKETKSYDFEKSGQKDIAANAYYYTVDGDDNIKPSDSSKIIVGKSNVKTYFDQDGKAKTFIISPIDYSQMRVGIMTTDFQSIYHKSIELSVTGSAKLYSVRDNLSQTLPSGTKLTLDMSGKSIKLSYNESSVSYKNRIYISGTNIQINSIKRGNPQVYPVYNGTLEFVPEKNGITMIDELSMEDYLKKVVPSEMPTTGGIEALKCQAVAARTYAISDMLSNRFSNLGFYVNDSTQSQVFNNVRTNTMASNAVSQTSGVIMTYKSKPIDAKYYSTSCGFGTNFKDIWFNSDFSSESEPYLDWQSYLIPNRNAPKNEKEWLAFFKDSTIGAYDSTSMYYRWKISYSKDTLSDILKNSLKYIYTSNKKYITLKLGSKTYTNWVEPNKLKNISILKRSHSGNVKSISFIFDNITINVSQDYNIRGALRCRTSPTDTSLIVELGSDKKLKNVNYLLSSFFSIEKSGNTFTVYGGGYGHGVGMSQYGAMQLSKIGQNYQAILSIYYKGVKFESIY